MTELCSRKAGVDMSTTNETRIVLDAKIAAFNAILANATTAQYNTALDELKTASKECRKAASEETLARLLSGSDPMKQAATEFVFSFDSFKLLKDDDTKVVTAAVYDASEAVIPVKTLTEQIAKGKQSGKVPYADAVTTPEWMYMAECLVYYITLRLAADLGYTKEALAEVSKKYDVSSKALKSIIADNGGVNPTSNGQLEKSLQQIIDRMVFIGNEKKVNTLKVTKTDVAFMTNAFTRKGAKLTIEVIQGRRMLELVFELLHKLVTEAAYKVAYREDKKAETERALPAWLFESETAAKKPAAKKPTTKKTAA